MIFEMRLTTQAEAVDMTPVSTYMKGIPQQCLPADEREGCFAARSQITTSKVTWTRVPVTSRGVVNPHRGTVTLVGEKSSVASYAETPASYGYGAAVLGDACGTIAAAAAASTSSRGAL